MKKLIIVSVLVVAVVVGVFQWGPGYVEQQFNQLQRSDPLPVSQQARDLHKSLLIGDWHSDSLMWARDLNQRSERGHVDIPRLQQGNVALQMFTTVTKSPAGLNYERNDTEASDNITKLAVLQGWPIATWSSLTARALYQADKLHQLVNGNTSKLRFIDSKSGLQNFILARQLNPLLVGVLLGTEGSHALDGELENIQRLYDAGFRMMSLQHFFDNKLGGSLHGTSQQGLSEFGKQAVQLMQDKQILLDLSHSSEQVVKDVLAISTRPLLISHTGLAGHCQSPRNISDELMQTIARTGGLIAVGYWDGAVCDISVPNVAAAIKYGIELVGAEHIALGSDFDGATTVAFDSSEMLQLTQALLNAGLSEPQIRLVMGENMLHFLQANLPD